MDPGQVTLLLRQVTGGDKTALDELIPLVYAELRRLAGGFLRGERAGHTLQPTALVNEAYARMVRQDQPSFRDRAHFLSVAARLMRQILIDHARAHRAQKRGSGGIAASLEEAASAAIEQPAVMIALADALDELETHDERKARIVELRYFGGLTLAETAEVMGATIDSIRHELRVAQAFLHRELARPAEE